MCMSWHCGRKRSTHADTVETMQRLQAQEPNLHHPVKFVPLLILNMSMLFVHMKESKQSATFQGNVKEIDFFFTEMVALVYLGSCA